MKASELRAELLKIADREGRLEAETVVAHATPEDHPLHPQFEWNNDKAGHKYRVDQARRLIQSVHVVYRPRNEGTTIAQIFVRDPSRDPQVPGYRTVETIKSDAEMAARAVQNEFDRCDVILRRAHELAEVLGMASRVQHILDQIAALRADLKTSRLTSESTPIE